MIRQREEPYHCGVQGLKLRTKTLSHDFMSYNGRKFVPESLQERLSRQFCMLTATLVDCECDLETIQELERSYKLTSYCGEKGSISKRMAGRK